MCNTFQYSNKIQIQLGNTRLVAVDYLDFVNNVTIGQLIIRTLIEWSIPFDFHDF
jgi:hypothetical protein